MNTVAKASTLIFLLVEMTSHFALFFQPVQMFGHPGAGGQFGYGDSSTQLGVAYVSNYMDLDPKSFEHLPPRYSNLLYATYDCLNVLEGVSVIRKIYMFVGQLEDDKKAADK